PAFTKILSWKAGSFEAMGAEPDRNRTIFKSYNGLLLETAQALDELQSGAKPEKTDGSTAISPLSQISQIEGIEFVLAMEPGEDKQDVARGLENPERMSLWARQTLNAFRELGDKLHAGTLDRIDCLGPQRHVSLASHNDTEFCLGWKNTMKADQMREMTKKVFGLWAS